MAFGSFNQGGAQPMADINTTPLVDVMLVLLIIFIVTAPLMTQSIAVTLPKVASVAADTPPQTVKLGLDADGQRFWDSEPVRAEDFAARLAAAAAQTPQPVLQLSADQATRYQHVAEVMAAARAAGIEKLGFVTVPGGAHGTR